METSASDSTLLAAVIGGLSLVVTAGLTAVVTWRVAVWKTRESAKVARQKEIELRVWDLQRVGYSVVLRELERLSETASGIDEGYQASPREEEEPHTFGSSATSGRTWPECQSEFAKNQLVFSKEFVEAFRALESDLENAGLQMYPSQIAAGEAWAFQKAYGDLMRIALKDLGLDEGGPKQ